MPDPRAEFDLLMRRVRAGCPEAARDVFERYSAHVRRVVRRQLHKRLRAQFDSADFLQAVWASFFTGPPARYTFESPEALIGFLSEVAYNKVVETFRQRLRTAKHGFGRQESLDRWTVPPPADDPEQPPPEPVARRQPTPSQEVMAAESWERLLANQSPACRRVLELLRQGHSHREVADQLRLPTKFVQRVLQKLRPKVDLP